MRRGFENRSVVRGLVGGLGGRCKGRIVWQDKASAVSHGAPPRFRSPLRSLSHRARTLRTARTAFAKACNFSLVSASIRSPAERSFCTTTSTTLIPTRLCHIANRELLLRSPAAPAPKESNG